MAALVVFGFLVPALPSRVLVDLLPGPALYFGFVVLQLRAQELPMGDDVVPT